MDYKQAILDALEIMRKKSVADKEVFKARAYSKVANQIKELTSVSSYDDVSGISGIGEKIRDKIIEILATGQLVAANKAKSTYNLDAIDIFLKIYGVGPAKAKEIIDAGIYTIEALRKEFTRCSSLKNPPKYYNDLTAIGLKYYEPLLERIPREEMLVHQQVIGMYMAPKYQFEIVGSFRRQAVNSGDIDALIRVPDEFISNKKHNYIQTFYDYVGKLKACGYIHEILALGDKKCMAICAVAPGKFRRLDLLITPPTEYAYAILYFTGSDKFNVAFRQHALACGYTLNEHTMTSTNTTAIPPPIMNSEKDIFNFLRLKYIEPHMRIDITQIISFT